MSGHPDLYTDYRAAKRAAAALAVACRATLLQHPATGKPRILMGSRVIDCATWLAAWSHLHQIRLDQITNHSARR